MWTATRPSHGLARTAIHMRWVNSRIFRRIPDIHRTLRAQQMTRLLSMQALFQETPVSIPTVLEVKLTPEEDRLCTLLDECKRDLAGKGTNVECRIAGGWVRDKVRRHIRWFQIRWIDFGSEDSYWALKATISISLWRT